MNMETIQQLQEMAIIWLATNGMALLIALIIVLIGWTLAKKARSLLLRGLDTKGVDPILGKFLSNLLFWLFMGVTLMIAADHMGLNVASLLAVVGTMGLAIGLAIKDNISNFSSGVMLILLRPFTKGDYVLIAGVAGTVQDISLSTTTLSTPDNQKIIVPNAQIVGTVITNVTANPTRRIDLVVGVGYDDDLDKARGVLEQVLKDEKGLLAEPAWTVAVSELADSSVNFVVRPWCRTEDYWTVRFRLTENIKKALDNASISIPYPQTDVHLHQVGQ
ncbi:MAG: mechanosensitive ion channel family protein [Desulfovibrionaceae bacterium]